MSLHSGTFKAEYSKQSVSDLLSQPDTLAVFEFGRCPLTAVEDQRHIPVALPTLGDSPQCEVWRVDQPPTRGQWESIRFAKTDHLTLGHLALDLDDFKDMRSASRFAYSQLFQYIQQQDHHWWYKIWHYIPAINQGSGDQERYRQFCIGRAEAIPAELGIQAAMPAATAIGIPVGCPTNCFQIYFLAGPTPGLHVENPRQTSAWHYPREYGPRSPIFSRGTMFGLGQKKYFLISGTASVLGHATQHLNNAQAQAEESVRNVHSLLAEGGRLLNTAPHQIRADDILKVYIRDPAEFPAIQACLETELGSVVSTIYLQGDICRSNLLTEIDGIGHL